MSEICNYLHAARRIKDFPERGGANGSCLTLTRVMSSHVVGVEGIL